MGLSVPVVVYAQALAEPPAALSSPVASPPPPIILRGSRPAPTQPAAVCPPGYILSSDYGSGCIAPSGGDYAEGSQNYSYWPDYGLGYPFGGLPVFGAGAGRFHRPGAHGFRGLPGRAGFHGPMGLHGSAGFHGPTGFHGQARFGSFATAGGHMGGFGHR
jgi:hypothetical protein